ncbi:helix-turn-helix domain-containing protein [Hominifimenecus sp. rT4P-3]|uniref:helix-turn-helix domain-containing protein n=1 Tax=Hominifimenecus sp. rT4P-3 TaxID=3242979 RepID=UPI003DA24B82
MEIYERIQELRKTLGMSRRVFGEKLGVTESVIVNIEFDRLKRPDQKEPIYQLICEKYQVSEEWLRYGTGEMFKKTLPIDETAELVYGLLNEDDNPFFEVILDMIRTYRELDEPAKKTIKQYFWALKEQLQNKKEG